MTSEAQSKSIGKEATADSVGSTGTGSAYDAVLVLDQERAGQSDSLLKLAFRRLMRDYLSLLAIGIVVLLTLLSFFAPPITRALDISHTSVDDEAFLEIGTPGHILGTDDLGRDQLARLLYGGRISLAIATAAAIGSLAIGMSIGVIAGFYQGGSLALVDDLLMWFVTTLNSIPTLFLLLIVASVLRARDMGDSVMTLILILTFLGWTGTMRLVRGETLAKREFEYTVAARSIGASSWRIMFVHILPNIFSLMVVTLAIDIGTLILVESALSYLGLGVTPPTPSWGNMLNNAQSFFDRGPHLVFLPGLLIVITVLCLYIIGDGLRDAFDPQASRN